MDEAKGAERALTKFYAELIDTLPINEMLADFRANKLLRGIHKTKFKSLSTEKEKAQYFLDEVIKTSLSVGCTEQFNKMIAVMKSSDDSTVKHLAKQIIMCALDDSSSSSSSDDNGM